MIQNSGNIFNKFHEIYLTPNLIETTFHKSLL